jgi:twitching motility protein PilT
VHPIDPILDAAIALNATDVHLQAGLPPVFRVQRGLVQKSSEVLSPRDVEDLVTSLMTDHQKRIFREKRDYDFSCSVPGRARFRVNAFHQRDTVAAALRRIPFEIPTPRVLASRRA